MNDVSRRPWRVWATCAVLLPILAACSAGAGDSSPGGDTQAENTTTTTTNELDTDVERIAVRLDVPKTTLEAHEGLALRLTLTNGANHAVRVLKWFTGVDGVHDPLFSVERDGIPVEYVGPRYKRAAPGPSDYVVLAPGASITSTVALDDAYDLSASGNYGAHYLADIPNAKSTIQSNHVFAWAEGRPLLRVESPIEMSPDVLGLGFSGGCSASQKTSLTSALGAASSYANNALTYLNGTPGSKPRFTTWFGSYSSTHWSTAKTHYTKMKSAFDTKGFTIDCSCTDNSTYAYVYPNQAYKIYVCGAFWSAPMTGTDSKGGTLVHETSHFTVVAGTKDHVYGQTACRRLATSNANQALDNADSHEYFAENHPAQN